MTKIIRLSPEETFMTKLYRQHTVSPERALSIPNAEVSYETPTSLELLDFIREKYPCEVRCWAESWADDIARYMRTLKIVHFFLPRTGSNFLSTNFHAQDWCFCFSERTRFGIVDPGGGTLGTECGLSYEKFTKSAVLMWKRPLHDLKWAGDFLVRIDPDGTRHTVNSICPPSDFSTREKIDFTETVATRMLALMESCAIKCAVFLFRHPWSTFQSLKRLQQKQGVRHGKNATSVVLKHRLMNSIPETYCQMINLIDYFPRHSGSPGIFFHEELIEPKLRAEAMNRFFSKMEIVLPTGHSSEGLVKMTPEYQDVTEWVKNHKFSEELQGFGYFDPNRKVTVADEMKIVANRKIDFLSEIETLIRETNHGEGNMISEMFMNFYKDFEQQSDEMEKRHET